MTVNKLDFGKYLPERMFNFYTRSAIKIIAIKLSKKRPSGSGSGSV